MTDKKTWAKRVAAWRASGDSATVFAAREGYAASSLRNWASRLGRDVELVRVVRSEPAQSKAEGIEIRVGTARVFVPSGADTEALRVVLEALRGWA